MPSYVYPAVFHPDTKEGGYLITFPDLPGCITEGKDLDEALYMAQDAMKVWLDCTIEDKVPLSPPSDAKSIALEEGEFVNFIRVEVRDTSAVRRSVSIPKCPSEPVPRPARRSPGASERGLTPFRRTRGAPGVQQPHLPPRHGPVLHPVRVHLHRVAGQYGGDVEDRQLIEQQGIHPHRRHTG